MRPGSILNKLAKSRTILANERTLLAYVRTAIMLAVSGVTLIKFFPDDLYLSLLGFALPPAALILAIFGFVRYRIMCKHVTVDFKEEVEITTQ